MQIDFDPSVVSYECLLDVFWRSHSPVSRTWSRQYMAAVFYDGPEQERLARESLEREHARRGQEIHTKILLLERFYRAEDYHQKHRLQSDRELTSQIRGAYPDFQGFVDSTAAARLNGYLDGEGSAAQLERELPLLGLSEPSAEKMRRIVGGRKAGLGASCGIS